VYYVFVVQALGLECDYKPGVSADVLNLIIALCSNLPEDHETRADAGEPVIAGPKPSFEALLRAFHRRVYNLAYRLLGDPDEAADLTQETFVRAYKAYPKFQGAAEATYPWLCQIAVNGCKNRFKELSRRGRFEAWSLDEPIGSDDLTVEAEIGDGSSNPAAVFERRDLEGKIQDAIQALPPEFRVVVVLRDMHGLSYKEITEVTGLTLDVVKVRLFRGRGMLRRRLSPYIEG
jgi:RNA polymerase sigma-70 factor, ECF subfamily